jgi:hypothetical protein
MHSQASQQPRRKEELTAQLMVTAEALRVIRLGAAALARHPDDLLPLLHDIWPAIRRLFPRADIVWCPEAHLTDVVVIGEEAAKDVAEGLSTVAYLSTLTEKRGAGYSASTGAAGAKQLMTKALACQRNVVSHYLVTTGLFSSGQSSSTPVTSSHQILIGGSNVLDLVGTAESAVSRAHAMSMHLLQHLQGKTASASSNSTPYSGSAPGLMATPALTAGAASVQTISGTHTLDPARCALYAACLELVASLIAGPCAEGSGACAAEFLRSRVADELLPSLVAVLRAAYAATIIRESKARSVIPSYYQQLFASARHLGKQLLRPSVTIERPLPEATAADQNVEDEDASTEAAAGTNAPEIMGSTSTPGMPRPNLSPASYLGDASAAKDDLAPTVPTRFTLCTPLLKPSSIPALELQALLFPMDDF